MGKLRPGQMGPASPHSQAGFRNGPERGPSPRLGSGALTVFPPLELEQPRPGISRVAQGNKARLPGQVCSLLEVGIGSPSSGEPKQGCEHRVVSDLRHPYTYPGGWRMRLPGSAALEEKLLPPANSG